LSLPNEDDEDDDDENSFRLNPPLLKLLLVNGLLLKLLLPLENPLLPVKIR